MKQVDVLRVAWLAVALGVGMELLILLVNAVGPGSLPGLKLIAADLVQKVSWSFFVCVGLAFGAAAAKVRQSAMGLAGFLVAPMAFHVAKILHKGTLQALEAAAPTAGGAPSVAVLVAIRAVEYAWLGAALGWLSNRSASVRLYVSVGLVTGAVCAGFILWMSMTGGAKPSVAALVSKGVNELFFPLGCSLVLCAAQGTGKSRRA